MQTSFNPDLWSDQATQASLLGERELAHRCACMTIKARACWVLVNGKWRKRAGLMRK